MTDKYVWYLEGIHGQLLDEITAAETKRKGAQDEADQWQDERDERIRRLLADDVPVRAIVDASRLSRERVYQIRDRRR